MSGAVARRAWLSAAWRWAVEWALGPLAVTGLTFVGFRLGVSAPTAALLYMLVVVAISLRAALAAAVLTSVVAALCLDFFFTPPLFRVSVTDPIDLLGTFAFATTAVVITSLLAKQHRARAALEAARDQVARMARLTTMGELAASIADEIRQPLAAIVIDSAATQRWLNRDPPELDEAREGLSRIVRSAERAEAVMRSLRTLARKSGPRLGPLDLGDTIREVLTLTQSELHRQAVSVHTELDQTSQRVLGDRVQLQQVLLNLLANGVEAMSTVTDGQRALTIRTEAGQPGEVVVSVEDTGPGLAPAAADHIFEPFFTTKPEGLGMGLAICRSIIDAHGGRLWAGPHSPHGMTFRFTVPEAETR